MDWCVLGMLSLRHNHLTVHINTEAPPLPVEVLRCGFEGEGSHALISQTGRSVVRDWVVPALTKC